MHIRAGPCQQPARATLTPTMCSLSLLKTLSPVDHLLISVSLKSNNRFVVLLLLFHLPIGCTGHRGTTLASVPLVVATPATPRGGSAVPGVGAQALSHAEP